MRASLKIDGKWEVVELPPDPVAQSDWLWAHDGQQAVVTDDETKTFYCGREQELTLYQERGDKAAMFYDLEKRLRAKMPAVQQVFETVNAVFPDSTCISVQDKC